LPTSLDDLVSLAMFARVVEAKSFTAAAAALGVSKSIISKRVSGLEEHLGVRLLHRTTRRLSLSSEGARVYERCLHMLRAADEAPELVRETDGEPRGELRVTSSVIVSDRYLAEVVVSFVKRYPLVLVDVMADNSMLDFVSDQVDIAIRLAPALESSSLIARRLATAAKVVCASPAYLSERGTPRWPDELRSHDCLRFSPLPVEVEWKFKVGRDSVVVPASGPMRSNDVEVLRRAALAGAGVVNLPGFYVAADLQAGRLVQVLAEYPVQALGVFAVYAKGKFVPAKVRKFVEHLAAHLRKDESLTR